MKRSVSQLSTDVSSVVKSEKKKAPAKLRKSFTSDDDTIKSECNILTSKTVFLVGQAEESMIGDSFMLSNASPVFKAMLIGDLQERNEIKVPDIEPDAFKTMLKFIHGKRVSFSDMDHAARVCYAADKYDLPNLKRLCSQHLYPCSVDELWTALHCSIIYNCDFLRNGAMKLWREKTYEVLESPQFVLLNKDALKQILQDEHLDINSEVDLFNALIRWAKHQCTVAGMSFQPNNLRNVIGDMIKYIRFLSMTETEVIRCGKFIFTADEVEILLQYLKGNSESKSMGFISGETDKRRKLKNGHEVLTGFPSVVYSVCFNANNKVTANYGSNDLGSLCLQLPFTIKLHSVTIPTRSALYGHGSRFYFEEVKVTVKQKDGQTVASGEFIGKVNYDTELRIPMLTNDKKFPSLPSPDWKTPYYFKLVFRTMEVFYYPVRWCSYSSFFKNSDSVSFIWGIEYSR